MGAYLDGGGGGHGFVRDKGHGARRDEGDFTTIDHPDAVETAAMAINDRGQIVGGYVDAGGTTQGFLLDEGDFTAIDHPDAASGTIDGASAGTATFGLNNRGQIVGQYIDTDLRCHGFLLNGATFTTIDDPDAQSATGAADINDRGQMVGFRDGATGLRPCAQGASTSASDPESTDQ